MSDCAVLEETGLKTHGLWEMHGEVMAVTSPQAGGGVDMNAGVSPGRKPTVNFAVFRAASLLFK